jgi:DNA repair photolyase
MTKYIEYRTLTSVLAPKQREINDLLLVTRPIRIYDGCEFGCLYCDGWSYADSPINESIRITVNLPERLAEDLMHVQPGDVIGLVLGEPYQSAEEQYRITRKTLEILAARRQPCVILTKSPRIIEDLPLLQEMNRRSFAIVAITVVTVDESLMQLLEPEAPPVAQRIEAISRLKQAGIPSGFALLPIFPFLTDRKDHVARTLDVMAAADPDFVIWGPLWLPNERHRQRIQSLLKATVPDISSRCQELYGSNPTPQESYQRMLDRQLFVECQKRGLQTRIPPQVYMNHLPEEMASKLLRRRQQFIDFASGVNG